MTNVWKRVKLYQSTDAAGYVTAHIVAENQADIEEATSRYLSEYRVYDARLTEKTGLTSTIRRFYRQ